MGSIVNDDGTHSILYVSLNAGIVLIDSVTIVEFFNLANELGGAEDTESVLIRWSEGYRDSDLHGLADAPDGWEAALRREVMRRHRDAE
jgi:hypothetical protein